jgi:hypothetical protein
MYKNSTRSAKKRYLIIFVAVIVAGLIITGLFFGLRHSTNTAPKIPGSDVTKAQKKAAAEEYLKEKRAVTETAPVQPALDSATGSSQQPQTISVTAKRESKDSVTVISKLYNVSDGKCTLTINNGPNTYTDTADIIYQPEYSTCAGFSIPISKLGIGLWSVNVSYMSAGHTNSNSTTVDVK